MKRWLVWVGMALVTTTLLKADWVVVQKVEERGQKQPSEITLKVKGDKIRTDLSPDISIIMDTTSGDTTTLQHSQKTALQISATASKQLIKRMELLREENKTAGVPDEPVKLEPTGKRETIAGQETKIYTAQAGAMKMTWWIAENNPDLDKYLGVFEQLQKSSMVRLGCGMTLLPGDFKFPGVPLKTELATPDGRKIATTIISIKEQPLEEIDFTVPPGYRSLPKPSFGPNNP